MNFKPTMTTIKRLIAAAALAAVLLAGSGLLPVANQSEGVAIADSDGAANNDSMRDLPWIVVPNGNFWSG